MPQLNYVGQVVLTVGGMSMGGWVLGVTVELVRRKVTRANSKPAVAKSTHRFLGNDRRPKRHYPNPVR